MRKSIYILTALAAAIAGLVGCTVKYSLSGTALSPNARTVSVAYFPNDAPMVAISLSPTLTEELKEKLTRQTKLELIDDGGDLQYEGRIIRYMAQPAAISSGEDRAVKNKLTIEVEVTFINSVQPEYSFTKKRFSQYYEFDASEDLSVAEDWLIPTIVEMLVDDIFKASVAAW